jgi:hypothetical protein
MGFKNFFQKLASKSIFEQTKLSAEKRTKLNVKNITTIFVTILIIVLLGILCSSLSEDDRQVQSASIPDYSKPLAGNTAQSPEKQSQSNQGKSHFNNGGGIGYSATYGSSSTNSRSRNANQVIKRGQNGNDPGAQIPVGTMIGAKLLTHIHSGNTASPVIAQITEEIVNDSGIAIPINTKIIGTSTFNEEMRRIDIHFSTLVYEDGSQHSIQAMAMMKDGSAGLSGEYHSARTAQQIGKFIGNFTSGLADGLKERIAGGAFTGSIEPGSIKNGLLNAVELSAEDVTKTYSDDLSNEKPSMSLNAESPFFIFLEREYLP